ncbi:MAG TPA: DNA-3-methyladenine glycosylase I [Acidimicrobiales bacterium]|nr:DNA-3-methyladenine glycosylase I [Acidimicrobiales bacterium]
MSVTKKRCAWCGDDEVYVAYHDREWGVPLHDDDHLFELLCLEGAQAGLSWITILRKREGYRRAFKKFDPRKVAGFGDAQIDTLLGDASIVRHRGKITSVITNARAVLDVQRRHGSFNTYVWALGTSSPDAQSAAAAMSKQLRKDGFAFVGPMTCYSFMQSAGMVNDHARDCFRYNEIEKLRRRDAASYSTGG